jgi:hypothetical protein
MKATYRLATLGDAKRLFELRRKSIIALAPKGMSVAQAEIWAANLTAAGMERKIRELEIWIVELNDTVVGWGQFVATTWRDYIRTRNLSAEASGQNCSACSKR